MNPGEVAIPLLDVELWELILAWVVSISVHVSSIQFIRLCIYNSFSDDTSS
jgi:hypothetical protein